MKKALNEYYINGIETTIPIHLKVLHNPDFLKGNYSTTLIEKTSNSNSDTIIDSGFEIIPWSIIMIIVMKQNASDEQINEVISLVEKQGFKPHLSKGVERTIIGVIGRKDKSPLQSFASLNSVESVIPILKPFKLSSIEIKNGYSVIDVDGICDNWKDSKSREVYRGVEFPAEWLPTLLNSFTTVSTFWPATL